MRVSRWIGMGAALILAVSLSTAALAQTPGAAQPPARQGGRGGGQGRGGFGGFGGAPTLSNLPLPFLNWTLSLSQAQQTKIQAIQEKSRTDMRALFQPDASGQRPDRATMQPKLQALNDQTKKDIEAVLNPGQTKRVPGALKLAEIYNSTGIPLAVAPDLKLTQDQNTKLAAISDAAAKDRESTQKDFAAARQSGDQQKLQDMMQAMRASRQATQEKAQAVLTDTQKAAIAQYEKDHPRGNRGGGGRRNQGAGAAPGNPA